MIAVGGGALEKDESFHILKSLGLLIWVDTAPLAIAWRLMQNLTELKKRPLLSDLPNEGDRSQCFERLRVRLETLHSQRVTRYSEATLILRDNVSGPEICAQKLRYLIDNHLGAKNLQSVKTED